MTGMGRALMGTGYGTGDKRAIEAAQQAISSPLLEDVSINGATGILINITGGPDLTLAEMNEACSLIAEAADPDANIIFGSVIDANAGDEVRITVIATGFNAHAQRAPDAGRGRGSTAARGREDQMALPMQASAAMAQAPTMMVQQPLDEPVGTDVEPDAARRLRGAGAARPATAARPSTSTSSTRAWPRFRRPRWAPSRRRPAERARVDAVGAPERPIVRPQAANTVPPVPRPPVGADAVAAPGRRAGRRGVGVRQADLPAPRPVRARVGITELGCSSAS